MARAYRLRRHAQPARVTSRSQHAFFPYGPTLRFLRSGVLARRCLGKNSRFSRSDATDRKVKLGHKPFLRKS